MAELKYKITVEGVEKALSNASKLEAELQQIKKLYKEKHNVIIDNKQALAALQSIKEEQRKANDELENIGKNVRFANFKAAMKSISGELVNLATVAATSGKSTSENINDIGTSIAGIASNFGIVGAAAGALITVITPVISSMFELSDSEKAVEQAMAAVTEEVVKSTNVLNENFDVLTKTNASYTDRAEAIKNIKELLPSYLQGLDLEKASLADLNEYRELSISLIRKEAITKAFATEKAALSKKILDAEIKAEKEAIRLKAEFIRSGTSEAKATELVNNARLQGLGYFGDYYNVLENTTAELKRVEQAEAELLATQDNRLKITTKLSAAVAAGFGNQKTSDKTTKDFGFSTPFKPVELFSDTYIEQLKELNDLISSGSISISDYDRAVSKLKDSSDVWLKSLAPNVKATQLLLDQKKQLTENIQLLDDEFKKNALFAIQFQEGTANAAGLTGKAYQDAKKQILDITMEAYRGSATIAETVDKLSKLSFVNQSKSLQQLLRDYNTYSDQKAQKAAQLTKIEKELNADVNSAYARAKIQVDKDFEDLEKKKTDVQIAEAKRAAAAQQNANDEAAKKALLSFDEKIKEFTNNYKQSIEDYKTANKQLFNDILGINRDLSANIFTLTSSGFIEVDEETLRKTYDNLQAQNKKAEMDILDSKLAAAEASNRTLLLKERDYNEKRKDLARTFIKDNNLILKELQQSEFEEFIKLNGRTLEQNKRFQNESLTDLQEYVRQRKETGKAQTQEEREIIQRRLEEALQLEQDNLNLRLQNELKADEERIFRLRLLAGDNAEANEELLKLESDLAYKRLLIIQASGDEQVKIRKEYLDLIEKDDKARADKLAKEEEARRKQRIKEFTDVVKELQNFSNALLDLINQNSQNIVDNLNEQLRIVEDSTAQTLERISQLEDDLEGKRSGRREAVLQALEQQREIEADLARQRIALAEQVAAEEKKINKRKQAASIANAVINGALAITNVFATSAPPLSFILAGITAATTAVQVATIANQKFAKGGFTGSGGQRDETGHKVAGVVHNDEWVAPKWMVESPKFSGVINKLESARQKGYADGGFTSPDFNALGQAANPNPTSRMERMLMQYAEASLRLADRPVKVSATEIQNTANINSGRKARITT